MKILQFFCLACWAFGAKAFSVGRRGRFPTGVRSVIATSTRRSVFQIRATHEDLAEPATPSSQSFKHFISNIWTDDLRNKTTKTLVTGLALYYLYKGFLSASGATRFWKREGGMILQPLSVATWSGELIG
jgi:hypothetical protein